MHVYQCIFYSVDKTDHTDVLIGDQLYSWGGHQPDLPLTHDSPEKREFTSTVGVFDIHNTSYNTIHTTGTPPNGVMDYSSCSVGRDIYYFGGRCNRDCYHNNLFSLNTTTNHWTEVITTNNNG